MSYLWGGSQAVAESAAHLAPAYGAWPSSRKRAWNHPLSRSNPGSDHNTANKLSYAIDFATFNGAPLARAIARWFGFGGAFRVGNYNRYNIQRGGATFSIQDLWAVQGHFNHVHLGVRRVGGTYRPVRSDPLRGLSRGQRAQADRLLYHRRVMLKEARTGKGPRYRKNLKWARYWKKKVTRSRRRAQGHQRAILSRVLAARSGRL